MSPDEDRSQLAEIAVILLLDLGNSPGVLTTLDRLTLVVLDILLGANDGEGHGVDENLSVLQSLLIILFQRRLVHLDALSLNHCANSGLELLKISRAESVGLGDNGNQVDTGTETLHDLNVQRLESVASRTDEVQTGVHTEVNLLRSARLLLLKHVRFMLVIQELDDRLP